MHLLSTFDTGVLLAYLMLIFAMGFYFARGNHSTEEYFLGGRKFKGWVIGLSLTGTSISSITFLAYPGDAFKTNWLRFLPNLMLPLAIIVAAFWFLPRLRRGGFTAYEFLETRFGAPIRAYGATVFIVAQLARISMILYLLSLLIQGMTGLDAQLSVLVAGICVAGYTLLGGIKAVVWTDLVQTLVLLLGGILCLATIINLIPGGLPQLLDLAWSSNKLSVGDRPLNLADWGLSLNHKTATMMLLVGLTSWLTEYSSNQNTVQRFCATETLAEARKAMFLCAAVSLPTWAFFMFLGTALYVFFYLFPDITATAILNGDRKAEEILPLFITHYLPPGLIGLVIAAAIAAAMSSLDSSMNAIAMVGTSDVYRRFIAPAKRDQDYLRMARGITAVTGLLMVAGALYLIEAETSTLQDTASILTALLAGGLLTIYLIGFFSRRCGLLHILLGIAGTMLYTAWTLMTGIERFGYPFDLYYTGLIGNILMFVIAWGSSFIIRPAYRHVPAQGE